MLALGLFIGRLGTKRTFAVYDRTADIKLPSDLAGVTMATYRLYVSGNLEAALGAACTKIKRSIEVQGVREDRSPEILSEIKEAKGQAAVTEPEERRTEVVTEVGRFLESLLEFYEEAAATGRGSISERFSEKKLKSWKYKVLKFLDANFQTDEAAPFADLHSSAGGATPLGHLSSSYEEHRDFLKTLCEEAKEGRGPLKSSPHPSGNRLSRFGSFVYRN